jgi:hypothetical protein
MIPEGHYLVNGMPDISRGARFMKRLGCALSVFSLLLVIPGCGESGLFGLQRANIAGPTSILASAEEQFDDQRLAQMITRATNGSGGRTETPAAIAASANAADIAIQSFWPAIRDANASSKAGVAENKARAARNEIQGELITASAQRCNWFKAYLRRLSSDSDLAFGLASIVSGGVGAILTGVNGARIASGVSAIFGGARAEFDHDIMSGLTSSVIIPGIETARTQIMGEIITRRCLGLGSYSLSLAIADAVRFHGACSFDVGVKVASQAIEHANDNSVGINALATTLMQLKNVRDAAAALNAKPGTPTAPSALTPLAVTDTKVPDWLSGMSLPVVECPELDGTGQLPTQPGLLDVKSMRTIPPAAPPLPPKQKSAG